MPFGAVEEVADLDPAARRWSAGRGPRTRARNRRSGRRRPGCWASRRRPCSRIGRRCDDVLRQAVLAQPPAGDVHLVDALVADVAVAVVPVPVPLVVEAVRVERPLGRGAEPEVVIDPFGHGRIGLVADRRRGACSRGPWPGRPCRACRPSGGTRRPPATPSELRFCVPVCTTRPYFRAASTILRPSRTLWLTGFSTYTSLPAWQAHTAARACQWSGVAIETTSIDLSSINRLRSETSRGALPDFSSTSLAGPANCRESTSQSATTAELRLLQNPSMCAPPRPRTPITATRIRSFGPTAFAPLPRAIEAAPAPALARKYRRLTPDMGSASGSWVWAELARNLGEVKQPAARLPGARGRATSWSRVRGGIRAGLSRPGGRRRGRGAGPHAP